MALKFFEIEFKELAKHKYLRNDVKYWHTINSFINLNSKNVKIKDIFYLINSKSYTQFYTNQKTNIPYIRIGNLSYRYSIGENSLIYLDKDIKIPKDKILQKDDLILATIGNTIGKINLVRDFEGGTFSNNTILLRFKKKDIYNPLFIEKLLQTKLMQKYIWGVISQKAQPNLQIYDLENIKIPQIPKHIQDQIVARIEPIEQKIKQLKSQIKPPQEIINKVFAREFGFDENLYNEFGKGMTAGTQMAQNRKLRVFETEFQNFARSSILRFSTRFHNPPTKKLMDFMDNIKTLKVEDILTEAIHRGTSPKYDSSGEIPVVKTKHLKNGKKNLFQKNFIIKKKGHKLKKMMFYLLQLGKFH